jgi:chemotaxis protein CheD
VQHIIGVADMKISTHPEDELITFALGSCLGVSVYDPVAHVGGLLHVMLPLSTIDPAKATENPCMFVDTGVPRLFLDCYKAGAKKRRLVVKVAGGASAYGGQEDDHFQVGKRNFLMFRKLLLKNGVLLQAHDVGGNHSRTMTLDIGTGHVSLKTQGVTTTL